MLSMELVFWVGVAVRGYVFAGSPLLTAVLGRYHRRAEWTNGPPSSVSVVRASKLLSPASVAEPLMLEPSEPAFERRVVGVERAATAVEPFDPSAYMVPN